MKGEGQPYLQQVCDYVGQGGKGGRGRINATTVGIIGAAYETKAIWRTKYYSDELVFMQDLAASMLEAGDTRNPETVPKSYMAIPFIHSNENDGPQPVLILYVDSNERNVFGDSEQSNLVAMAVGFSSLLDTLLDPLANISTLQNYPFPPLPSLNVNNPTVYSKIQEIQPNAAVPVLERLEWFNFEAN